MWTCSSGRMLLDDEVVEFRLWDVARVAPEGGDGVPGKAAWLDDV
jgi:hypothetical protein